MRNLQIVPFNYNHAVRAGEILLNLRANSGVPDGAQRVVVINDIKLFSQADIEIDIDGFVISDTEARKLFEATKICCPLSFPFYDINTPCHEAFGYLPLQ